MAVTSWDKYIWGRKWNNGLVVLPESEAQVVLFLAYENPNTNSHVMHDFHMMLDSDPWRGNIRFTWLSVVELPCLES